jgi:hypothetical protein
VVLGLLAMLVFSAINGRKQEVIELEESDLEEVACPTYKSWLTCLKLHLSS